MTYFPGKQLYSSKYKRKTEPRNVSNNSPNRILDQTITDSLGKISDGLKLFRSLYVSTDRVSII